MIRNRRRRSFVPSNEAVEPRLLMTITAQSLNQIQNDDFANATVFSSAPARQVGGDGLRDLHLQVFGLPAANPIAVIDINDGSSTSYQYHEPFAANFPGVDLSKITPALGLNPDKTGANIYIQDQAVLNNATVHVHLTFADQTTSDIDITGVYNDPKLRVTHLSATPPRQDEGDTANATNQPGPDGFRDLHIHLDGIQGRGIALIDVTDGASHHFQYHETWADPSTYNASLPTPTLGRPGGNPFLVIAPASYGPTADLYLQDPAYFPAYRTGTLHVTLTYGDGTHDSIDIGGVVNSPTLRTASGDYNGDGKTDIASYFTNTATWYVRNSDGSQTAAQYGAVGHDVPVPGDYGGDGKTDIAVYRMDTAEWFTGNHSTQFGWAGHDTPVPSFYDNGNQTNLAVYRSETAEWFLKHSDGTTEHEQFGWALHDIPVPGDFDGNGFSQIAVYRPLDAATAAQGGGTWYIRDVNTGTTHTITFAGTFGNAIPFSQPGDIPVPADYDGIGHAEPALYRPSTGMFIIYNQVENRIETQVVGKPGSDDVPVPGDYDGDGKVDPAVYSPSTAQWTYLQSSNGQTVNVSYGYAGHDEATPGPVDYRIFFAVSAMTRWNTLPPAASTAGSPGTSGTVTASSVTQTGAATAAVIAPGPGTLSAYRRRVAGKGFAGGSSVAPLMSLRGAV